MSDKKNSDATPVADATRADDKIMSAQEVADALGVDAKVFRQRVRKHNGGTLQSSGHGKNARYGFRASQLDTLRALFGGASSSASRVIVDVATDTPDA